jgi:hypothetical protein
LEKGALKIIYGWLVAAAADEQTSILRQLLQVRWPGLFVVRMENILSFGWCESTLSVF